MSSAPDIIKAKVLKILRKGGSVRDAADYARISRADLADRRRQDPAFAADVRHAIAAGKYRQLARLAKNDRCQTAAFLLERRWPDQFANSKRTARPKKTTKIVRFQPIPPQPKENRRNADSP